MTKLTCIFIFSLLTFASYGQTKFDNEKARIDSVCNKIMQNFTEKKISEAMQLLKQNTVIDHSSIDELQETIIDQTNTYFPKYGKILSYEFISEGKVKDFIVKRYYILKFEKYFLKFDFTLYRGGKSWTITNFKYDENLLEVLY